MYCAHGVIKIKNWEKGVGGGGGQRESFRGTGGRRRRSEEDVGEQHTGPPFPRGFPLDGGSGRGLREPVRGSWGEGTALLWGSGQEALIHPRTRSDFFLTKNQRGKRK